MALGVGRLSLGATTATALPSLALRRATLWGLLFAKILAGWGVQWDIQWHVQIGRDTFWIPPHVMTYAGVMLAVVLSFGLLAWDTLTRRPAPETSGATAWLRVAGFTSTPGVHLAAWGIGLTVLAAPIDDLWHRLFGLDVTLWSPPHLLGIVGAVINTLACFLIAREVYPARSVGRFAATILSGAILYGGLHLVVDPASLVAYRHGGLRFYTFPILAALILPLPLVSTTRLAGTRWAPLLLVLTIIPIGMVGARIAWTGFEMIQPVSVIQEEIAKDPNSEIAVAYTIAQRNGFPPGRTGGRQHVYALLPVLAMSLVDARRRPLAATAAYAVALFGVMAWILTHRPAFAPLAPGPIETALGLALTLLAALPAAIAARRLSNALERLERGQAFTS